MKRIIAAIAAVGAVGTSLAAGQGTQWDEIELDGGGMEFRLGNDEGASIILGCHTQGVFAGFEFPEPLKNAEQASVRGVPGDRQNVAVAQVSDKVVRVSTGDGIEVTLRLLRNAASFYVRVAGFSETFNTSGSGHVVRRCIERQEDGIGLPTRRF